MNLHTDREEKMNSTIELEENVKKLVVRLRNVEEGKQIDNLVQIVEDLHAHTFCENGMFWHGLLKCCIFFL